jgi:hypothetical protein
MQLLSERLGPILGKFNKLHSANTGQICESTNEKVLFPPLGTA